MIRMAGGGGPGGGWNIPVVSPTLHEFSYGNQTFYSQGGGGGGGYQNGALSTYSGDGANAVGTNDRPVAGGGGGSSIANGHEGTNVNSLNTNGGNGADGELITITGEDVLWRRWRWWW